MKFTLLQFEPTPLKVLKKVLERKYNVKELAQELDFQSSVGIAEGHPPAIKCRWIETATSQGQVLVEWDGYELYQMEGYEKGKDEEQFKILLKNSYYSFQAYFRKAQKQVGISIPDLPEPDETKLEECVQGLLRNIHKRL